MFSKFCVNHFLIYHLIEHKSHLHLEAPCHWHLYKHIWKDERHHGWVSDLCTLEDICSWFAIAFNGHSGNMSTHATHEARDIKLNQIHRFIVRRHIGISMLNTKTAYTKSNKLSSKLRCDINEVRLYYKMCGSHVPICNNCMSHAGPIY